MGKLPYIKIHHVVGEIANNLNSKTWMSGNDVSVVLLDCNDVDGKRTCSGGPMAIDPKNVRKICNAPRC
jgi:hypothetical protein